MRWIKRLLIALIVLTTIIFIIGMVLPNDYRVERSIHIDAPIQIIFDQVNNLKNWDAWSPWIANDSSIQNTHSGPESGVGAKVVWESERSGSGSQTITRSEPPNKIETALAFGDMDTATSDFVFTQSGSGTQVTWGMSGETNRPLGGIFAKMIGGWVGKDYEDGLRRLKSYTEELPDRVETATGTN